MTDREHKLVSMNPTIRQDQMPLVTLPHGIANFAKNAELIQVSGGESDCEVLRLRVTEFDGYLKHGKGDAAQDVVDEMTKLRWLTKHIAVPTIQYFESTSDEAWLLTAALDGETCFEALRARPEDRLLIIDELAKFLCQLHAIPVENCPFNSGHLFRMQQARQRIDAGLVAVEDFDSDRVGWDAERVWREVNNRLPFTSDHVVTHGDFTLDNIIVNGGHIVGCIDVGRAGIADRYQDIALMWSYLEEFGSSARDRFLISYGINTIDTDKLQFHLELDELF